MEKQRKETWIKIPSTKHVEEYMEYILSLAEKNLPGDIQVILYAAEEKAIKRLPHSCDISIASLNVLREKYGEENVKPVTQTYEEHVSAERETAYQLRRIADAMEGIQQSLEILENLTGVGFPENE